MPAYGSAYLQQPGFLARLRMLKGEFAKFNGELCTPESSDGDGGFIFQLVHKAEVVELHLDEAFFEVVKDPTAHVHGDWETIRAECDEQPIDDRAAR